MIGIYYWKNLITGDMYIGQSIDIERRKKAHERAYYDLLKKNKLYENMRKYGLNNFEFGILEECEAKDLNNREIYYISFYHTYPNQLNSTSGGTTVQGDCNPNTSLTNQDVLNIRNRVYLNNEDIWDVYLDYDSLISEDSFWSLVHGITWKTVDTSMIYSLKERGYRLFDGSKNPKSCLNEQDVINIRKRHFNQESNQSIYKDYEDKISYSAFCKIIQGSTWKNICPEFCSGEVKVQREGKPKAKLTKENVIAIRKKYKEGMTLQELYKEYSFVTPKTIQRVVNYETWKNVE